MSKSNKPNHAKGSRRQQQPKVCPPGSKRKVPESQKLTAFFGLGRLDTPLSPEPGHADVPAEKAARIECVGEDSADGTEPDDSTKKSVPAKKSNSSGKSRTKCGAATYKSKFQPGWTTEWPFIKKGLTQHHFWCEICRTENACYHMGHADVERHIESESHQRKVKAVEQSQQITKFTVNTAPKVDNMTQLEAKARRAEIKVAVTMVNHNVPLAVADHFSPLMKECFKDSDVAQRYGAARTKTTCIINRAIAPYLHDELVKKMRNRPYTLSTDGSNDTGREKMNPLTVKLFDVDRVEHMFLDMCITTGTNAATAETIFEKMDSVLKKDNIPWQNCVGLSVDNANVNMGVCNSIKSRILSINPTVYVHGCPCHIVHNNASAAGTHYIELSDFDVEDVVVDIGYWFKASTKRKCRLDEFCVFCDTEYMAVIDHVSTRWLSLETAVVRILQLYRALVSYFKSNIEKQARFKRLRKHFEDPMTEVHLLFYQATLPVFTEFNLLFQRQEPSVYLLHGQMRSYVKKLMSKFVTTTAIKNADVCEVEYKDKQNQVADHKLNVGWTTRTTLNRLHEAGEISQYQVDNFHKAVRAFFVAAVDYAFKKLPFKEPVLEHSQFIDFQQKMDCDVNDALYFVYRFSHLLPYGDPKEQDKLSEEFLDYQLMEEKGIPRSIWEQAVSRVSEQEVYHRMDKVWAHMATIKSPVTGMPKLPMLSKVAQLILTLPHSNADAERVFSMIGLNKTDTRNALALEGTLSSIMTIKMSGMEPNCFKYEPPAEVIKASKSAASSYNREHAAASNAGSECT
ncbi:uncharacterized protein LOC117403636 [Acipenser ruthenus]|uniref:uncharacterized protein LOC117403636 n=1 Tax=Acipenser ruthenus TaxID=7906 RepID=UPI0027421999|nr:uncharacterized protein LOC117403636 [Acipenser ruthenus]